MSEMWQWERENIYNGSSHLMVILALKHEEMTQVQVVSKL